MYFHLYPYDVFAQTDSNFQDTRSKLFNEYLNCGEDFTQVEVVFQRRLEESQKSKVKYGFRNDQWLVQHHGQVKADKIMHRKSNLGLNLGLKLHSTKSETSCLQMTSFWDCLGTPASPICVLAWACNHQ